MNEFGQIILQMTKIVISFVGVAKANFIDMHRISVVGK